MVYRGQVRGGVVVLEVGASLPEGTLVCVSPLSVSSEPGDDALLDMPSLAVDTGISDLATNIDHYLYGHPKASDAR